MLDKKTADALEFLKTINDFLISSGSRDIDEEVLHYLQSEKGYKPQSVVEITPHLVADIANALEIADGNPSHYDPFDEQISNITDRLCRFYKSDTTVLNNVLVDKVYTFDMDGRIEELYMDTATNIPVTSENYYDKGMLHMEHKEYEDALSCFMQGLDKDNEKEFELVRGILITFLYMERDCEAQQWYERMLKILEKKNCSHARFEVHFEVGQALHSRKEYVKAIEQFSLATGAVKKVFLHGRLINSKDISVNAGEKLPMDIFGTLEYIHYVLKELRDMPDIPEIAEEKQKSLSDIKFIVHRMEKVASREVMGKDEQVEGDKSGNKEELMEQIKECMKDITDNPDDFFAYFNMGYFYSQLEMHKKQDACYDAILKIDPRNTYAWVEKGNVLKTLGRCEESLKYYDKAVEINPDYAEGWYGKGNALADLGRFSEALDCFDQALRIDPEFPEAWHNKGAALISLGRKEESLECVEEALRLNPAFAEAWYAKGVLLTEFDREQEALSCYEESTRLDPRYADGWHNRATLLDMLGRREEAIAFYDEALRIDPLNAITLNNKGSVLMALGKYKQAAECFDTALKADPAYAPSYYNKACIGVLTSNKDYALKNLRKAVKMDSSLKDNARKDKDFTDIREDRDFQKIIS